MYLANWNVNNMPFGEAATNSIAMTLWAFLGLESACANADAVDNLCVIRIWFRSYDIWFNRYICWLDSLWICIRSI